MISIIGSPISPYVKKVLTLLNMKGVDFEVDPITPFYGNDEFTKLSPLRRIPVFIDGDFVLNDSSVIAQYIEETWPAPPALPDMAKQRAKARWFEEFASSRMGNIFVWKCFVPMIVLPRVFGTAPNETEFQKIVDTDVVDIMDFLEAHAPKDGFFVEAFGLADIAIAAMFRVMHYTNWTPSEGRWPRMCAWLARAEAEPALSLATAWSDALVKVRAEERREVACKIGLALTPDTLASKTPRRGPMTVV